LTYTIWMCCGRFEQAHTSDEALSLAVSMMNSDCGHRVLGVEGPDGEDLMKQAEQLDDQRTQEWLRQQEAQRRIGYVEVLGPTGKWWGKVYCYTAQDKDEKMADIIGEYGQGRVRWVAEPSV
jgi:hypothetical protein